MPFGSAFAILYLSLVGIWLGGHYGMQATAAARATGVCLALAAVGIATALLLGRRWARWAGAAAALCGLAFAWAGPAPARGALGALLLLASAAATLLLLAPPTGRDRRPARTAAGPRLGAAEVASLAGAAGLVAILGWGGPGPAATDPGGAATLPAAAVARSVRWVGFADGAARARAEGRIRLVTFVTAWCPYCSKMRDSTWRDARVARRLEELVAVRVDAEETTARPGPAGAELATRYGVRGFPSQLLLDPEGRVIDRVDGFQSARQLIQWLDRSLPGPGGDRGPRSGEV